MTTEYEAKFYPVEKQPMRELLKAKGARLVQAEVKTTIAVFNKRTNPQIDGNYIRVRNEGNVVRLSVKIHAAADGDLADQKELDTVVQSFDDAVAILQHAGLTQSGFQEKMRETWELNGAEVVIDTWPGLETYIEIEARSEAAVRATAELLNLDWDDKIITSVVEIFMKKYGLPAEDILSIMKNLTFDHNPFRELQPVS